MRIESWVLLVLAVSIPVMADGQSSAPADSCHPMALRHLPFGREFNETTSGTINENARVPRPQVISKAEWGGGPTSNSVRTHFPSQLTLHHEGSPRPLTPEKDPKQLLRNLQQWGWRERNWPDIPYHLLIDLEGSIYEARPIDYVGDTATTYDPTGHLLVTVMGNYEIQAPNEKQLTALADLLAWLADYYNINPETLAAHMNYASTACPGKFLYPYVASGFLEGEIRKRIRKAYLGYELEPTKQ
jgi:hypothetical protein